MEKCNSMVKVFYCDLFFGIVWINFLDEGLLNLRLGLSKVDCSGSKPFLVESSALSELLYKLHTLSD